MKFVVFFFFFLEVPMSQLEKVEGIELEGMYTTTFLCCAKQGAGCNTSQLEIGNQSPCPCVN